MNFNRRGVAMPEVLRGRKLLAAVALSLACGTAWADVPAQRSALDAPLFYQLLLGEMELRNSQPGQAYQLYLDAARRTQDAQLFRRAIGPTVRPISLAAGSQPSGQRKGLPNRTPRIRAPCNGPSRLRRVTSTSGSSGMRALCENEFQSTWSGHA